MDLVFHPVLFVALLCAAAAAVALLWRQSGGGGPAVGDVATVTALYIYPVKSCAGVRVESFETDRLGPESDRRWILSDPGGAAITARECPATVLIRPELERDAEGRVTALVLRHPDDTGGEADALRLAAVPPDDACEDAVVRIFGQPVRARRYADARVGEWLEARIGRPARLLTLLPRDAHDRPIPAKYDTQPHEEGVGAAFADAFPWLLASESSLESLRGDCPLRDIDMRNFRPNIVVSGSRAWEEDSWHALRVGGCEFFNLKPCTRCVLTTANPDTGRRNRGGEPLKTLRRVRHTTLNGYRRDDSSVCFFGVNLVHTSARSSVRVGDTVTVRTLKREGEQ